MKGYSLHHRAKRIAGLGNHVLMYVEGGKTRRLDRHFRLRSIHDRVLIDHVIGGKYRITELIGQGGMGTVFEAVHTGTGSRVAIKLIVSNDIKEEVFVRFQREARAAGTIDSHHIVRIFDMGTDERSGSPFMVMERLFGEDLSQVMRRVGPINPTVALAITAQAALGLAKAHDAGIVHRDIKPANLFLHDGGDNGETVVKILDFGIAKVLMDAMQRAEEGGLTRTGSMLGSPHYMSPEQAQGLKTIDHRSDIWSLGVVLYKMLTGQTPHAHLQTLGQVILAICSQPARPVQELAPWVPAEVATVVHRALQPDPRHRYQTIAELYQALTPLLAGQPAIRRVEIQALSHEQRMRIAQPLARAGDVPTNGTQIGMTQQVGHVAPSKSSSGLVMAMASAGVLAAVGLAGIGFAVMSKKPASAATNAPSSSTVVTVAPTTSGAPTASAETSAATPVGTAPTPVERTVTLAVSPATAVVEVDGQKRQVTDGSVTLKGALGSVVNVKVTSGASTTTQTVAITEGGAIPSKVIAGAPAIASPTGASRPIVAAGGGGGARPVASSKVAPSGTGVNVQRTFE